MTNDQADRIISLLEMILERLPVVSNPWTVTPNVFPQPPTVVPNWQPPIPCYPMLQPTIHADCGCALNTVCMNVSCPRRSFIVCQQGQNAASN